MELIGVLIGMAVLLGGPLTLFLVALTALSSAKRAERAVMALELEVHELRAELQRLQGGAAPVRAPAPRPVAPARPAAPAPAVQPAPPPAGEPAPGVPLDRGAPDGATTAAAQGDTGLPAEEPRIPAPAPAEAPAAGAAARAAAEALPVRPPLSPERVITWIAAGLGGLSVLLAVGFGVSVAIERGVLGPAIRAGGGLTAGTALWLLSERVRARRLPWLGAALMGAGVGAIFGVLWAATARWGLLPPLAAFGLMAATSAVATLSAWRRSDRFAASLGALGALMTPVLVSTGEARGAPLFAYLTVVSLGAVLPAVRRGHAEVIALLAIGSAGLHLGWAAKVHAPAEQATALVGAFALSLPFAIAVARAPGAPSAGRGPARIAATLMPLVALPWMAPIDPVFFDARTGVEVWRAAPGELLRAAVALLVLPLPALALVRWRTAGASVVPSVALLSLAVLILGARASMGLDGDGAPPPALPAALLAAAAPALALLGGLGVARAAAAVALPAGLLTVAIPIGLLAAGSTPPGPPLLLATLVTAAAALRPRRAALLPVGLAAAALPALAAAAVHLQTGASDDPNALTVPLAAASLFTLVAFGVLPLAHTDWRRGPGALAAAAAGAAVFYPLWEAWEKSPLAPAVGLLPLILGAVALLGAAMLIRQERVDRASGRLAALVAMALMGAVAAVPLQLQDAWLTVAWALEGAAVATLSRKLRHPLLRQAPLLLGAAVTVRLVANPWALEYGDAGGWPVLNWTLWTWGAPMAALLWAAAKGPRDDGLGPLRAVALGMMAIAVGFALVNVQVAHAFAVGSALELRDHGLVEGMVRSIAWAVYGLAVLGVGSWLQQKPTRIVGFLLVLLAAAKVFAVDLWSLSGLARVGSVLGLGVTLLLSAWLFERIVRRGDPRAEGEA